MAPPSPLAILTGATNRLVKEHDMYQKECTEMETQIQVHQKLFDEEGNTKDENSEYMLNQKARYLDPRLRCTADTASYRKRLCCRRRGFSPASRPRSRRMSPNCSKKSPTPGTRTGRS